MNNNSQRNRSNSTKERLKRALMTVLALTFIASGLTSCRDRQDPVRPIFQGMYSPKAVQMTLGSRSGGKKIDFTIDNINMRIYNSTPLPYNTSLDSAYLVMYLSNQVPMTIVNEQTGVQNWTPGDTAKISIKGGKLRLNINRKDRPELSYDFRIISYGYDPNKLTWEKLPSTVLSSASGEGQVARLGEKYYYMASTDRGTEVFSISFSPTTFTPLEGSVAPQGAKAGTLMTDKHGLAWVVSEDGSLYSSSDLKSWNRSYRKGQIPGEDAEIVSILSDNSKDEDKSATLSVVTKSTEGYFFRNIKKDPSGNFGTFVGRKEQTPPLFPITGGYVYSYTVSGTQHSNIFGGFTKTGEPSRKSFFTSDGIHWAETPYSSIIGNIPEVGGLYLSDPYTPGRIFLVGGTYDGKPSGKIKVSTDRGITWTELKEEQLPPAEFVARTNAAGLIMRDEKGIEHVYIIGGNISGKPSQEVWHGYLDTTGGVVNGYE